MSTRRDNHIDMSRSDRMMAGLTAPEDAPPGYEHVAALIRAAAGPATAAELSHESAVLPRALEALASPGTPAPADHRSRISRLLSAKVAAAATVAAFGLGTAAAAATGSLPGQSGGHPATIQVSDSSTTASTTTTTDQSTLTSSPVVDQGTSQPTGSGAVPATGPANQQAQFGLCTAFLAGGPTTATTDLPPRDHSTAFQALLAEHGGVAGTTSYCQGVVAAKHATTTTTPHGATAHGSGTSHTPNTSAGHAGTARPSHTSSGGHGG